MTKRGARRSFCSLLSFFLVALSLTLMGCEEPKADRALCRVIFDRLVVLELQEMGFVDPVLAARRQAELAHRYEERLGECIGKTVPSDIEPCIANASSPEELSRRCLH